MLPGKVIDLQALADGLGQGVLVFDSANRLVLENLAARTIFGNDLKLIRADGWRAAVALFNSRLTAQDRTIDAVRAQALASERPVRFSTYRHGEYLPCWASAIHGAGGEVYTVISIETPDWSAMHDLIGRFLDEARSTVESTQGHADLIAQSLKRQKPGETLEGLNKRIGGFNRIISTQMHRLAMLLELMDRLEHVRTGRVREAVRSARRRIVLADFFEDFLEEMDGRTLVDPETDAQDFRARITLSVPSDLVVAASRDHLTFVLRDLLRNAIMYSMRATPIKIMARADDQSIQIDVIDEGYGVRSSEAERVFTPFLRARQPQIIGEFGYGLSLSLCKQEIEAMNGRMWFESEEGVGSTFSFKLPQWRDEPLPAEGHSQPDSAAPA